MDLESTIWIKKEEITEECINEAGTMALEDPLYVGEPSLQVKPEDIGEPSLEVKQEDELKYQVDDSEQSVLGDPLYVGESSLQVKPEPSLEVKQEDELKYQVDDSEQSIMADKELAEVPAKLSKWFTLDEWKQMSYYEKRRTLNVLENYCTLTGLGINVPKPDFMHPNLHKVPRIPTQKIPVHSTNKVTEAPKEKGQCSFRDAGEVSSVQHSQTLRLYPPLSFIDREVTKDYVIPGTGISLPTGMGVVVSLLGLHRDPLFWDNPDIFVPERFNRQKQNKRPNYVYMPFGIGPRNCIGMRMGQMQIRAGIAHILANFSVRVAPFTPCSLQMDPSHAVLTPKGDLHLLFKKL